jgi:NTE family protein
VYLQALVDLERRGTLADVKDYWGTSAGALVASLLSLSRSAVKTKALMLNTDYVKFRDFDVGNLLSITTTWGIDDGYALTRQLTSLLETLEPGSSKKTLLDVEGLNIVVSDLTSHETIVCNGTTYPSLTLIDALRASMSLPLFFKPYVHVPTGHLWVDGAVRANFPWHVLPSDTARHESLGFSFEKPWMGGPRTFSEYLFSMIHFDEPKKILSYKAKYPRNILWFPTPPYPAWFSTLRPEDFVLIDSIGQATVDRWLTDDSSRPPETSETLPHSSLPGTLEPVSLPHYTVETSDSQTPSTAPYLDSSPRQLPVRQSSSRRWSV